jgi:hypothetical protein
MPIDTLPPNILQGYEVKEWKHATAVLQSDYPNEYRDVVEILSAFRLLKSEVIAEGKNRSLVSRRLDGAFYARLWEQKSFSTKIVVDDRAIETPTHKVDCYRNGVALEIEWSNKDPFYDRDLNNFRLLFELRAISVGVIITKADSLKAVFQRIKVPAKRKGAKRKWTTAYEKFGASTTWMEKLLPRIDGGGGGGCPILVFAITPALFEEDCANGYIEESTGTEGGNPAKRSR